MTVEVLFHGGSSLHHLVLGQLFEAAVARVQLLQPLIDGLLQGLQDTLTQSSFHNALCRHKIRVKVERLTSPFISS